MSASTRSADSSTRAAKAGSVRAWSTSPWAISSTTPGSPEARTMSQPARTASTARSAGLQVLTWAAAEMSSVMTTPVKPRSPRSMSVTTTEEKTAGEPASMRV